VYGVAVLAGIHFRLRVKADAREPFIWLAVVALLLCIRFFDRGRSAAARRRPAAAAE
jgi:DMSO/TMAO reductase YedYZ heme-binding membrane subunit